MTLAELGMAFWHDLAAPVIAGILASMIVNATEVTCQTGVTTFHRGRKKNATAASG